MTVGPLLLVPLPILRDLLLNPDVAGQLHSHQLLHVFLSRQGRLELLPQQLRALHHLVQAPCSLSQYLHFDVILLLNFGFTLLLLLLELHKLYQMVALAIGEHLGAPDEAASGFLYLGVCRQGSLVRRSAHNRSRKLSHGAADIVEVKIAGEHLPFVPPQYLLLLLLHELAQINFTLKFVLECVQKFHQASTEVVGQAAL